MELTKVRFRLERDEDGWPPADSEGLWAEPLGDGRFRVDNTPWFAFGTSADDIVRALPDDQGVLWFRETLRRAAIRRFASFPEKTAR